MKRFASRMWRAALVCATTVAMSLTLAVPALAASLVQVTGFGANPTNLTMHLYVPDNVASRPGLLLALHWCTGTGPAFYSGTEFASLADRHGYIVIYPSTPNFGNCWDVSSAAALRRGGGSDPVGLMAMVDHVRSQYNVDASRIFVTGASSGGMMTNVMLGVYPDVFSAGAAFMGVPFGCFATPDGSNWNTACAQGQVSKTPQEWGDLVRAAYPGYAGPRPRMLAIHGVNDTVLYYNNFGEQIKQWTNVHGVSQTPAFTDTPQAGWTRTRYGGTGVQAPVEGISCSNLAHNLPAGGQAAMALAFFGLDQTAADTQAPTAPAGLAASNITASSVSLSWTAATDNVGVIGYQIFRQQGAGAATQVGTSTTTSFVAAGLAAATGYSFTVKAIDAAGNVSAGSAAITVTTANSGGTGDTQAPTAPANLVASGVTASGVTLSWSASTDNMGVTGYRVFSGSAQVATVAGTSHAATGLTPSTTYSFTVRAVDAAGNQSSASNAVTVTTQPDGGSGTAPCANAITVTGGNSGNFNTTGAACYRTSAAISGWGCYNATDRTVSVNSTATTCGAMPLPARWSDGYYYFFFSAGQYPWAGFYYW